MKDASFTPVQMLRVTAITVIVLWGVKEFSLVLKPVVFGLVLAYAVSPFPKWLMQRFTMPRRRAIAITAVVFTMGGLLSVFGVEVGVARLVAKAPVYEQRFTSLYGKVIGLMSAHGIDPAGFSARRILTAERLSDAAASLVPMAGAILIEAMLVLLMTFLFILEILPAKGGKPGWLAEALGRHGMHSKRYVILTSETGAINAVLNLAFLLAMGVDDAFLWCFVYFFLDFIPTVGFMIALIPPTVLTLLMYGWGRAVVVGCGLILTNLIVDNVITPVIAKKTMSISFLELTLSLLFGAFCLVYPGQLSRFLSPSRSKNSSGRLRRMRKLRTKHPDKSVRGDSRTVVDSENCGDELSCILPISPVGMRVLR